MLTHLHKRNSVLVFMHYKISFCDCNITESQSLDIEHPSYYYCNVNVNINTTLKRDFAALN